jgi:hypothetical protein
VLDSAESERTVRAYHKVYEEAVQKRKVDHKDFDGNAHRRREVAQKKRQVDRVDFGEAVVWGTMVGHGGIQPEGSGQGALKALRHLEGWGQELLVTVLLVAPPHTVPIVTHWQLRSRHRLHQSHLYPATAWQL